MAVGSADIRLVVQVVRGSKQQWGRGRLKTELCLSCKRMLMALLILLNNGVVVKLSHWIVTRWFSAIGIVLAVYFPASNKTMPTCDQAAKMKRHLPFPLTTLRLLLRPIALACALTNVPR